MQNYLNSLNDILLYFSSYTFREANERYFLSVSFIAKEIPITFNDILVVTNAKEYKNKDMYTRIQLFCVDVICHDTHLSYPAHLMQTIYLTLSRIISILWWLL